MDHLNKSWFGMVCNVNFGKHHGFFVARGIRDVDGGVYFNTHDLKREASFGELRRKDWDFVCYKFSLKRYTRRDRV